ncbi:MAG: polysaccharide deacetylase family protein [Clostridia bacterium]|nr:polysaccharide deacetylase family protein [Clostridia bacterium]
MYITFNYYPEGKRKALTMSYDDGQIHDRRLVDVFNKYGIKGTFHLNSGKFDTEPFLNSSEIGDLFKGHEISAHSLNHPFLTMVPSDVMIEEILEDRRRLEDLAGYPVRGMSYPFGNYNEDLVKALPFLGVEYSRTVQSHGGFRLPDNFLTWHPTCHHDQNLLDQCKKFKNTSEWDQMPLFYVWGHSFEFERNNNWELIEEFCKMVSLDENVWYATNIEIMDYIKAMKNLRFSVDRKMIFNPSSIPVWIAVDGQPVKIESGQRIAL